MSKTVTNLPVLIEQAQVKIAEVLPPGMDAARVVRLARLAVHRNPALMKCDPISVIESIMIASQLGLEINSPIGGAHLVPYKNRCQMIPDYRALIRLALQGGSVIKMVAREVYADDHFEILQGSDEKIVHIPAITDDARRDEDIIAFYAVATVPDRAGGVVTIHEYAPRGDVDKIRERSAAGNKGPWATDYAAMGKKTLIKRLIKWLDLTPELAIAIELDNRGDTGVGSASIPGDTERSISRELQHQAKSGLGEISDRLADERRTEIIGSEPVEEAVS